MSCKIKATMLSLLILAIPFSGCSKTKSVSVDKTPTQELTVYIPFGGSDVQMAINNYETTYHIKVTTVDLSGENYLTYSNRVSAELLAGNGPDVIFPSTLYTMNPYKAMSNNLFLDLKPYFDQDTEWKSADYFQPILNAGFYKGKQYIVPMNFSLPVYVSSTPGLKAIGFDWKTVTDMPSFLRQISAAVPKAQQISGFSQMMNYKYFYGDFLMQSGLNLLDYTQMKACADPKAIRSFFESYKSYFKTDYREDRVINTDNMGYKHVLANEYYFCSFFDMQSLFGTASVLKTNGGYTLSVPRDSSGKIHAITGNTVAVRANSKNKWNAYLFVKLLLSEDFQTAQFLYNPVNKKALAASIKKQQDTYTPSMHMDGGYICTKLSDEETQTIINQLSSADNCSIYDSKVMDMTYESMLPYFQDTKSYDDCYKEMQSKLSLYLDE